MRSEASKADESDGRREGEWLHAVLQAFITGEGPRGRYLEYPCEHFDPYVDPHFERIIADQLEFLTSVTGSVD